MFPRGPHPTKIGETDKPVPPKGRLHEGSATPSLVMDPLSQYRMSFLLVREVNRCAAGVWTMRLQPFRGKPSRTLRRTPRHLLSVFQGLLYTLVPPKCFPDTLPDDVLHRRVVWVLGRDQGHFLRLSEQSPTSLSHGARFGFGASVPEGIAPGGEGAPPRPERSRPPRGEETQKP